MRKIIKILHELNVGTSQKKKKKWAYKKIIRSLRMLCSTIFIYATMCIILIFYKMPTNSI